MANRRLSHYPDIGILGEDLVANWLLGEGWEILARRWRCRYGELDLIAQKSQKELPSLESSPFNRVSFNQPTTVVSPRASHVLAFVEVKTRSQGNWDENGILAITSQKQKKLWCAAEMFLAQYPNLVNLDCRFDVALVSCQRLAKNLNQSHSNAIAISPMRSLSVCFAESPLPNPVVPSPVQLGQPILVPGYQLSLEKYIPDAFEQPLN